MGSPIAASDASRVWRHHSIMYVLVEIRQMNNSFCFDNSFRVNISFVSLFKCFSVITQLIDHKIANYNTRISVQYIDMLITNIDNIVSIKQVVTPSLAGNDLSVIACPLGTVAQCMRMRTHGTRGVGGGGWGCARAASCPSPRVTLRAGTARAPIVCATWYPLNPPTYPCTHPHCIRTA